MAMSLERVYITDVTLREGDQAPLTSFTQVQKKVVALMLAEIGVDTIEVGFGANTVDYGNIHEVSQILKEYDVEISSLGRSTPGDTQASLSALSSVKKGRVHIFVAMSKDHLRGKFGGQEDSLEEIRTRILESALNNIEKVKKWERENDKRISIEFSPEDATGNALYEKEGKTYFDLIDNDDFEFLIKVCEEAIKAGATVINVPDTLGNLLPHQTFSFFDTLKKRLSHLECEYDFGLSSHIHNDLGTATANTIEAMRGGAKYLETTVLGIGERAGNAPTEEVIGIVSEKGHTIGNGQEYGLNSRIQTQLLGPTADFVRKILGVDKTLQSPFIGALSDSDGSGVHNANLDLYGGSKNKRTFGGEDIPEFFSARGGVNQLISMLDKYGIQLTRDEIFEHVSLYSQKAEKNRALYGANVYATYLESEGSYNINKFNIENNTLDIEVMLNNKKVSFQGSIEGENGIINTFIHLINAKLGAGTVKVVDLNIKSKANLYDEIQNFRDRVGDIVSEKFNIELNTIIEGLDNSIESSETEAITEVELEVNGKRIRSISSDNNTNLSSIKAILEGVLYDLSLQNPKNN